MFPNFARSAIFMTAASSLLGVALCGTASAESVRSECSAKYQAAKTAGTLNGLSWNKFYSQCAAEAKAGDTQPGAVTPPATPAAPPPVVPAAAPAAPPAAAPTKTVTAPPPVAAPAAAPTQATAAPMATGNVVFPSAISPKYSNLSAGKARFKTCDDQYQANKATNGNGGLKWIMKGGGYYSECNKKLKG
jgi:hypothetical protein